MASVNSLLIVDDNPQVRRLIRALLEDLVAELFECGDGALALAAYRQHLPDWVAMDIEMPQLDGLTASGQIIAAFPAANIVIVTRHSDAPMRQAALAYGARGFVAKDNLLALREIIAPAAAS